jgi:soluble lytic murein transglycosylase-like protein
MYALGHQIKTRYPKTQKNRPIVERVEPAARTRPAERRIERPAFVENFLRRNMNAGTIQEVENRWSGVAREALQYYQTRPGPRFIPAPDPEVNAACATGSHATRIPEALLKAIMRKESQYDPYAVSNALAMGPMQLKPDAMAELVRIRHPVQNPFDLSQSAEGGGFLLQHYMQRCRIITLNQGGRFVDRERNYTYQGSTTPFDQLPADIQYRIALRTYNAGPGILGEYKNRNGTYRVEDLINHHYPRDIMNYYYQNTGR